MAKWRHMLGSSAPDFEAYCKEKMKKVKRRVRKGIPDEFRGYAWQLLSGKLSALCYMRVCLDVYAVSPRFLTRLLPAYGLFWCAPGRKKRLG